MPQKTPQRPRRAKNGTPKSRAKAKPPQAVDQDPANRPGVPMETAPKPLAGARVPIALQHADVPVFKHAGRKQMPPVFGTAQPPKGLSGWIRKAAYAKPDHKPGHWMLLLLADRVDVWEHRLRRSLPWAAPSAAVLVAGLMWRARRA
ncbi:hypothetical protein [Corallococcus carmarthensis]|uniref:Uncharacterized protein n=1 Tax=Corallococcus carmarthensis TaxID=2316728 RepID=A0A3A8JUD0_9BACT|nr:hypothetical protein [Corallococcus carmarthensis]RKG98576.1 hypothetical protein D7X32_29165 [Corallococcus carmarthensis]